MTLENQYEYSGKHVTLDVVDDDEIDCTIQFPQFLLFLDREQFEDLESAVQKRRQLIAEQEGLK
jgi:hypothetical protein